MFDSKYNMILWDCCHLLGASYYYLHLQVDLRHFHNMFRRSGIRCSFYMKIQKQALQFQPRLKMATTEQQQHVTPGETATHRNAHTCFWYTQTRDTGKNNIRMIVKTKYK